MKHEKAKEYLSDIRKTCISIALMQQVLEEQRQAAGISSVVLSHDKISHGTNQDSITERHALQFIDADEDIQKEIDALLALKSDAVLLIQQMPDTMQRTILMMYYLVGGRITLKDIGDKIGYSEDTIKKNHRKALETLEEIMRKEE